MTPHRIWVYGDNVNTDVIFPGKYTYTLKTPADIAAHALEDLDATFVANVQAGDVIVAGRNWGAGSSREQAVTALKYNGISAIIAASFGGLYFRNCINQGVRPIICAELAPLVRAGDRIEIDGDTVRFGANSFPIPALSASAQRILDAGGLVPMLQLRFRGTVGAIQIGGGE
ncbi:MAG: 3-isopropylmalate dehydratase [Chloroflexota bacterium]|nr:3-isopropylmalate dehydratase [Chloroflexota bacterium]